MAHKSAQKGLTEATMDASRAEDRPAVTEADPDALLRNGVMPALSNPRYEQFCQPVAAGMSGAEALRQAGGAGTTAATCAYRLQQRPEVKARI
jgi:hypothetical protein